ncbi:hypothetical protein MMC22_003689 [Lobaria immixta]|nr:hypothetical protein [Lobaria immixta]
MARLWGSAPGEWMRGSIIRALALEVGAEATVIQGTDIDSMGKSKSPDRERKIAVEIREAIKWMYFDGDEENDDDDEYEDAALKLDPNYDERINEAISAFKLDGSRSALVVAQEFNIGRTALTNRLHGGASRSTRPPTNRTLTHKNKQFVIKLNASINVVDHPSFQWLVVRQTTYSSKLIESRPFLLPKSANHGPNFLSTASLSISSANKKPLAAKRDNAHDIDSMTKHFEAYQAVRTERGIADEDTWNMDETDFRIGCGRCHWVISTHWPATSLLGRRR